MSPRRKIIVVSYCIIDIILVELIFAFLFERYWAILPMSWQVYKGLIIAPSAFIFILLAAGYGYYIQLCFPTTAVGVIKIFWFSSGRLQSCVWYHKILPPEHLFIRCKR